MNIVRNLIVSTCAAALGLVVAASPASAVGITVTITNLAPGHGTFIMPAWVGFHDGTFDTFDLGSAASPAIEAAAEDGNNSGLADAFAMSGAGVVQRIVGDVFFFPQDTKAVTFNLDPLDPTNRYFSYFQMLIPSNDAFWGNDDPMAHPIFDDAGNVIGATILVLGTDVLDAGTEVNDEVFADGNTAFFGQVHPNTSIDEMGVVHAHPGYIPDGEILNFHDFNGLFTLEFFRADFIRQPGYQVALIEVAVASEPSLLLTMAVGLAGIGFAVRRKV